VEREGDDDRPERRGGLERADSEAVEADQDDNRACQREQREDQEAEVVLIRMTREREREEDDGAARRVEVAGEASEETRVLARLPIALGAAPGEPPDQGMANEGPQTLHARDRIGRKWAPLKHRQGRGEAAT
jgi:hypothetical protein